MRTHIQPCWTCRKYCGGCSWTKKEPEPMEGWVAVPAVKRSKKAVMHTYAIQHCPEYEWDGTEAKRVE